MGMEMITKEQIKKRMKRKGSMIWKVLAGATVIALFFPDMLYARENADIMQTRVEEKQAEVYIRGLPAIEGIRAQIGQEPVEASENEKGIEIHTIVLLDNSLSITEQNKMKIMEILKSYFEGKNEKEAVSIAVFGEDIEYLAEKETDAQKLTEVLGSVTYEDQDSYLTDVLYDELARLGGEEGYTKFIIATDGVDNKAIGYTKEELQESLKENNYPIYALGCIYKENQQELENLFAISRLTKGSYFLLDEYEEYEEILTALREEIKSIAVSIPENLCDGSERNLRLLIQTGNEEIELKTQINMPFSLKAERQGAEETESAVKQEEIAQQKEIQEQLREEEASQDESAKEETTAQEAAAKKSMGGFEGEEEAAAEEMSEKSEGVDLISVIAGAVIVIALVGLVLSKAKSGKKEGAEANKADKKTDKKAEKKADKKADKKGKKEPVMEEEPEERATELVDASGWEEGGTMFLSQESGKYIVALKDKNAPSKVFRYPLFDEVVVGRKREQGVHIVLNYDNSVSGKHCAISRMGEHFYIEDLHSSNHTYLNGKLVEGKVECKSGSTVTLGRLEMILELERM